MRDVVWQSKKMALGRCDRAAAKYKSRLEVLLSDIVRQRLQKIEASWQFGGITVRREVDSLFRVRSRKEHCFLFTS